jgi:hypothetical protein
MHSQQMTTESVVSRSVDIVFSQLDDELLAIDSEAGYCYSLNETAGRIWDMISSPLSIGEICRQLGKEYSVDEHVCRHEVLPLLQKLHDSGLIRVLEAQTDA